MPVYDMAKSRAQPLDKKDLLQRHPFFQGMDAHVIDALVARAIIRKMKSGTVLFRKGDPGSSLYAVLSGMVRISTGSSSGKDAVFAMMLPGEIFGEVAALDGLARSADAITIGSCEVMVIERRDLSPLLLEFPELSMRFIEILCSRLRRTSEQVEDIVFLDLSNRLAKVLLHLQTRASPASSIIRITQRELSQMIGASRESTNKQLRKWQRGKILRMERGGLVLVAPRALQELLDENAAA